MLDYAQQLPCVDPERIGMLGICGGGGYTVKAAIIDKRIKAAVSITGVNLGPLFRDGFSGFDPLGALEAMAAQRTAENAGTEQPIDIILPATVADGEAAGITDIDVPTGLAPERVIPFFAKHLSASIRTDELEAEE